MGTPEGGVDDGHAFDEDVPAAVGLDERRPQEVTGTVHPLRDRHAVFGLFAQAVAVGDLRAGMVGAPFPRPPVRLVGAAVERPLAGDGHVLALEGVDQRRVIHQLDAFPPRQHEGVTLGIVAEVDGGAARDVQLDAAGQPQRTGGVLARRHDHPSTTRPRAGVDRFLDVAAVCSDLEVVLRDARRRDAREDVGYAVPGIALRCPLSVGRWPLSVGRCPDPDHRWRTTRPEREPGAGRERLTDGGAAGDHSAVTCTFSGEATRFAHCST